MGYAYTTPRVRASTPAAVAPRVSVSPSSPRAWRLHRRARERARVHRARAIAKTFRRSCRHPCSSSPGPPRRPDLTPERSATLVRYPADRDESAFLHLSWTPRHLPSVDLTAATTRRDLVDPTASEPTSRQRRDRTLALRARARRYLPTRARRERGLHDDATSVTSPDAAAPRNARRLPVAGVLHVDPA